MSKSSRPRPERAPSDVFANGRSRSPSNAGFDGSATWSPSKFRKSMRVGKDDPMFQQLAAQLEKLSQETSKSPVSLDRLVGSKEYADVSFHIGSHILYAHRVVIETRCPPLFTIGIRDRGKKGNMLVFKTDEKVIDVRGLHLVLEYLYTGTVNFVEVNPMEVIVLMSLSELYSIERLTWLCERYLRAILNNELFFSLLRAANNANVLRAKNLCLDYGGQHFRELILLKEAVHTLGIELFREMVVHAVNTGSISDDPEKRNLPNTIKDEFKIIYTRMDNPDAIFIFKDDPKLVPCHRAILFAHSDKIKSLLTPANDEAGGPGSQASEGRYTLPKNIAMSAGAFKSLLTWLYFRDLTFSATHAAEMIPFAREFEINTLVAECDTKIKQGISVSSVIAIMSLCYSEYGKLGYKKDLLQECIDFVIFNFAAIDLGLLKGRSAKIGADITVAVRKAITDGVWKSIEGGAIIANGDYDHENASSSAAEGPGSSIFLPDLIQKTGSRTSMSDLTEGSKRSKTYRRNKAPVDAADSGKEESSSPIVSSRKMDSASPAASPATSEPSPLVVSKPEQVVEAPKNEEPAPVVVPVAVEPVIKEEPIKAIPDAGESAVVPVVEPAAAPKTPEKPVAPVEEKPVAPVEEKPATIVEKPAPVEEKIVEELAAPMVVAATPEKPSKAEKKPAPENGTAPSAEGKSPSKTDSREDLSSSGGSVGKKSRPIITPTKSQERVTLPEVKLRHVEPPTTPPKKHELDRDDSKRDVKSLAETFEAKSSEEKSPINSSRGKKSSSKEEKKKEKEKEREKEKEKEKSKSKDKKDKK